MRLTFISFFLLSVHGLMAQVIEKNINLKIEQVTIYLNGAEVKHKEAIHLAFGKTLLVIKDLSQFLDPATVQVQTNDQVKILSVSSEKDYLNIEKLEPRIKVIRDSVTILTNKITDINDEINSYTIEKEMLLENKSVGGANTGLTMEQLVKLADFFQSRVHAINKVISDLTEEKLKKTTILTQLNNELQKLNYNSNSVKYNVLVLVESNVTATVPLELRYTVSNTGWEPVYDIIATDVGEPIVLKYKAKAFNNTGVDWKNVDILLSSADPYLSAAQPDLQTWHLNFNTYSAYKQKSKGNISMDQLNEYNLYNSDERGTSGKKGESQQQSVQYKEVMVSDVSVEFRIKTPYSIPSDAKPYIIDISENQLEVQYSHIAIPKVDKSAFLLARITGWEKLNLIEGPANVYFNNAFIGKSQINPFDFSDTMSVSLGRDRNVLISRVEKQEFQSKNIIGSLRKDSYSYEIKIKNMHTKPIKLELRDQYPISQNSEITVDIEETSQAIQNPDNGELKWELTLAGGETRAYLLSYTIKYPKNKQVSTQAKYKAMSAPSF